MLKDVWQPIETAPRDGSTVIHDQIWYDGEWECKPTHWMPLPDPPEEL